MIWKIMAWLPPILAILAAATIPIGLGALLRLLFRRMNRSLPSLLAAAILLFLQEKLLPGALSTLLSTVMSASPEGNAGRSQQYGSSWLCTRLRVSPFPSFLLGLGPRLLIESETRGTPTKTRMRLRKPRRARGLHRIKADVVEAISYANCLR